MPEREAVRLYRADGWVTASFGSRVLFRFDEADTGMRNLAMVTMLTAVEAGGPRASARVIAHRRRTLVPA